MTGDAIIIAALSLDELGGYLGAVFGLWLIGLVAGMITIWLRVRDTESWAVNRGWRRRMDAIERLAIRADTLVVSFSTGLVVALAAGEILR